MNILYMHGRQHIFQFYNHRPHLNPGGIMYVKFVLSTTYRLLMVETNLAGLGPCGTRDYWGKIYRLLGVSLVFILQ